MKRYISYKEEKYYTCMLKIISAIGGRKLKYNWLITDIEAYPIEDNNLNRLINENKYLILSNDKFLDLLEEDDFQWIWGVFSAIPEKYSTKQILQYNLPYANGNTNIYKDNNYIIQHPLAEIEIVAEDSSSVFIVSKNDKIAELFKKTYPNSRENY